MATATAVLAQKEFLSGRSMGKLDSSPAVRVELDELSRVNLPNGEQLSPSTIETIMNLPNSCGTRSGKPARNAKSSGATSPIIGRRVDWCEMLWTATGASTF